GGSFLTATELADLLVRKRGLSFRVAHQIVGRAVARSIRRGGGEFDAPLLEEAAREILGRRLGLDEKAVNRTLSPRRAVEARKVLGGPSQPMVRAMATARKKALGTKRRALDERRARVEGSKKALLKAVGGLVK
ncbi:MAG: argininosuccinate lyase, partial [Euryarchaeota archaeon]|nr:argininosuccinate lyase [Euryarchaeota archaeon]